MDLRSVLSVTHNAREVGDLPTTDGGKLASGIIFRADALAELTDEGLAALAELRIGTIVDLRTDSEQARAADRLPTDGSITFLALPVLGGAMDEMVKQLMPASGPVALTAEQVAAIADQVPTLEELYVSILGSSAAQFAELARAVVTASTTDRPGVLFHCTAGKDRTGLAAALLLSLAGVPREAIVADYTLTETNLAGPFSQALTGLITGMGIPLTPRLTTLATKSPASAIETALDWIAAEHGDAAAYLRSGGLSIDEVEALRRVLLAE